MARPNTPTLASGLFHLIVLIAGHAVMVGVMRYLLNTFEPDPNGFRLNDVNEISVFAVLTAGPVLVGSFCRTRLAVAAVALLQALSPLILISTMKDPSADLNFAALLWRIPMPVLAAAIVAIDKGLGRSRGGQAS